MAEDFIRAIAQNIVAKDAAVSCEVTERERKEEQIKAQGPTFFKVFCDFLKQFADEAGAALAEAGINATQECSRDNDLALRLSRSRFPFINLNTAYQVGGSITIRYIAQNPFPPQGAVGGSQKPVQARFEISHHGKLVMILDGVEHHEPKQAAKQLIELVYSV